MEKLLEEVQRILYKNPNLAKPEYRGSHPLSGHCYVASETVWHLLGKRTSGFVPMNIQHEGISHWFLMNKITGHIIDLTCEQFNTPIPVDKAKTRSFLTAHPSKRAQKVLQALRNV